MKNLLLSAAAAIAFASPVLAQDLTNTGTSTSNAGAQSGSVSGASSNGNQQQQSNSNVGGNNAGIGSSTSTSGSDATANSSTRSDAASFGNRSDQSQGQSANNSQSQGQDARNTQSQGQTSTVSTGQSASNMQGVSVSNTFNSTPLKRQYIGTNTAVPLAASSSFSSDYCGGTVSGGASVAPIGVSIGASAPKFDDSCKYLRVAEKAGMMGANWHNMQQEEMAIKMQSLGTWATCMAGPRAKNASENATMQACIALGLMGTGGVAGTPPAPYVAPAPAPEPQRYITPMETQKPNDTHGTDDYLKPKTPRGATDPLITPGATAPVATAMTP